VSNNYFDVLIVGGGLSGIGAACSLTTNCPKKTYAILEGRANIGGTWDLFRYPGIRSDSDMFTLGYSFRPWVEGKAIADGHSILNYINETAKDYGIDKNIRFDHQVVRASWSSKDALWTVEAECGPDQHVARFTCGFLFICSGYYSYVEGIPRSSPAATALPANSCIHKNGPRIWPTQASTSL
jgi:cation diffusion facilitator CzcD-associated flavoprotein CzcO